MKFRQIPLLFIAPILMCTMLFIMCQKSTEVSDPTVNIDAKYSNEAVTDRDPLPNCLSCDLEWKIECPQSCAGNIDLFRVSFTTSKWEDAQCCSTNETSWGWAVGQIPPSESGWMDVKETQLKSAIIDAISCGGTYLNAEAYKSFPGNEIKRIPAQFYVRFRNKSNPGSLTTHLVKINQDLMPSCGLGGPLPSGTLPSYLFTLQNNCTVTSPFQVLNETIIPCSILNPNDPKGGG
jgi:hypothetical protein